MNRFISLIFYTTLLGSVVSPGYSRCSDWYITTLECQEYQKNLKKDPHQDICGKLIEKYPSDKKNSDELVKISFCLQHVSHPSKISSYTDAVLTKMPADEAWYFDTLKKLRIRKQVESALDLAWLCEKKFSHSPLIRTELSEIYLMNSDFIKAGISYLKELGASRSSYNSVKYQLTNLMRIASIEFTPGQLLDSLIDSPVAAEAVSLQILGDLCLNNKNYKGALACYAGRNKLGDIKWPDVKKLMEKFIREEIFEYSEFLLEDYPWKNIDPKSRAQAFEMFLTTHYNLKNWSKINQEFTESEKWQHLGWQQKFILATSLIRGNSGGKLNLDKAKKLSQQITRNLIDRAPSPWSYRAVFTNVEWLVSENQFKKASGILIKEKNNPGRLEGSGTLLFWMGLVALLEEDYVKADSLLVLATAYTNEEHTTRSLEVRNWLMMDTLSSNRRAFFRGMREAGLGIAKRLFTLESVPPSSPLWPHARFEMTKILGNSGHQDSAIVILNSIATGSRDNWMAINSKAISNFRAEKQKKAALSIAIYNEILVKYQQGVISEFSRERIKALKQKQVEK